MLVHISVLSTIIFLPYWQILVFFIITGFALITKQEIIKYLLFKAEKRLIAFQKDNPLHAKIQKLCKTLHVTLSSIEIYTASKCTSKIAVIVVNLFYQKRVVLYDNALNQCEDNITLAMLAHKLSYNQSLHARSLFLLNLAFHVGFFVISLHFAQNVSLAQGFGLSGIYSYAIWFFIVQWHELFMPLYQPFLHKLSHKMCLKADKKAAKYVSLTHIMEAIKIQHSSNQTTPLTHPLYSLAHAEEPTPL